jgi:hypothetical protein
LCAGKKDLGVNKARHQIKNIGCLLSDEPARERETCSPALKAR